MRNVKDYIFYKMYKFYGKFKTEIPVTKGIGFLFIIDVLAFGLLAWIIDLIMQLIFNKGHLEFSSSSYFLVYYIGFIGASLIHNIIRYTNKSNLAKIVEKYGQEGKDKFKTWQIFMIPLIIIGLGVLLVFLESKFGLTTITKGR